MTYSPELDAASSTPEQVQAENPFGDLVLASKNYWAGRTGREKPPAPTFRVVRGRKMLGRYMDPYGCQAHLRAQRSLWEKWYTGFFISCIPAILFGGADSIIGLFLVVPIYAVWYFSVKAKHRRQYYQYYDIQNQILQTGEPKWVPYDKARLKLLDRNPLAVWP